MRRGRAIVLGLALLLGGLWAYRQLFPPDEVRIRRTLVKTAAAASIHPQESVIEKLRSINSILDACTTEIEVVVDVPELRSHSIRGREELREVLAAARGTGESVAIELMDIGVKVNQDRTSAVAQFIARARLSGAEDELVQEFRVLMNRVEGEWKIHRVESLRSLQIE